MVSTCHPKNQWHHSRLLRRLLLSRLLTVFRAISLLGFHDCWHARHCSLRISIFVESLVESENNRSSLAFFDWMSVGMRLSVSSRRETSTSSSVGSGMPKCLWKLRYLASLGLDCSTWCSCITRYFYTWRVVSLSLSRLLAVPTPDPLRKSIITGYRLNERAHAGRSFCGSYWISDFTVPYGVLALGKSESSL